MTVSQERYRIRELDSSLRKFEGLITVKGWQCGAEAQFAVVLTQ